MASCEQRLLECTQQEELQDVAGTVYERAGFVAAVCGSSITKWDCVHEVFGSYQLATEFIVGKHGVGEG